MFRALVGWGIFSFAVLQVFEPVMHGLHLPEWTLSAVVVVLAAGFPATMVLAWIFDLGPAGVERTPAPPPDEQGRPRFGRKRLAAALVLLGLAMAAPGLAWWFLFRGRPAVLDAAAGAGPAPAVPAPPPPPGTAPAAGATAGTGTPAPRTIAVLPLANISGDASQDYFGDGITEEITSKLSRLRGLAVTARTSAAKFKGTQKSAREIGSELGVAYLVEGTVRRAGDRVRVNAALVRTSDAVQVWSEDQDARIDDIFAVQDRLAGRIVEALGVKLTPLEEKALANWGTRNAKAYDEFLKAEARYGEGGDNPKVLADSIAHLERALAIDPNFAPAVALLAEAMNLHYRDTDSSPAVLARAESLASRAMALDPQLPSAFTASASVRANRYDYAGAAQLYRKVTEAVPRDHVAWDALCWVLGYEGPPHLEEAEQACRKALTLQPAFFPSRYHLLRVYVQQGRIPEAEAELAELRKTEAGKLPESGEFWVYMATGRPADALAAVGRNEQTGLTIAWRAMALGQLGRKDEALAALEKALAGGYADGRDLRTSRYWDPLRSDPRFAAALQRHAISP